MGTPHDTAAALRAVADDINDVLNLSFQWFPAVPHQALTDAVDTLNAIADDIEPGKPGKPQAKPEPTEAAMPIGMTSMAHASHTEIPAPAQKIPVTPATTFPVQDKTAMPHPKPKPDPWPGEVPPPWPDKPLASKQDEHKAPKTASSKRKPKSTHKDPHHR